MTRTEDSGQRFPATHYSAIQDLASCNSELQSRAWDILITAYWKPVYKYVRIKWNSETESAKDLTQGFFVTALENGYFDHFDASVARFRTFLRICLDRYVMKEQAAATRLKRGGETRFVSLDFEAAEQEFCRSSSQDKSPDDFFNTEWIREVFSISLTRLEEECNRNGRKIPFRLFCRYDLEQIENGERLTYQQLADEFSISLSDVTNYLALIRREIRICVLSVIRELTVSDEEYREEVRTLLGSGPT